MTTEIADKAKELAEAAAQDEAARNADHAAEVAAAEVAETIARIEDERTDEKWAEMKTSLQEMKAQISAMSERMETVERVASEARDDIRQTREMVEAMAAEEDTESGETESQEESPDENRQEETETVVIAAEAEPEMQQSVPASEETAAESPRRRGLLFRK